MCGIAGIYNFAGHSSPIPCGKIENMLKAIRHRGPDESGIYINDNLGMGNVRLSIIDLKSGQQPLNILNKRYWIVYNGELFNYIELKKKLIEKGAKFYTESDTEVVIQAYAHFGPSCLDMFNGQFAFAIWDKTKKELFIARDRVGIRPLFYTLFKGSVYFCSEIKGIFENQEIPRKISPFSLSQIYTFWTTITPDTPFEDILELPPGHYLHLANNQIKIQKYWSLPFPSVDELSSQPLDTSIETFHELFHDSVRIRLRADVKVAAYLSGGIDSSITTAFIKKIEPSVLNTYSIGFDDTVFDETKYQLEAADYFQTAHKAFTCTNKEIGDHFFNSVYFGEFPVLRTAPTPMYLLSKKVREEKIKVVITGEGADEFFGGYNIFKEAKIRRFWANQPESTCRPELLTKLYPYLPQMKNSRGNMLKMFFGYRLSETKHPYYSHLLRWNNSSRISHYFQPDIKSQLLGFDPLALLDRIKNPSFDVLSNFAKAQYLESSIFMSGYLLSSQGDRMGMANSVEGRYPFLDHRLIEFAANLPDNAKLNCLNEKFILKKAMKGNIPESIFKRQKQAYRAPVSGSFFGNYSPEFVQEMFSENLLKSYGYFDSDRVSRLKNKAIVGDSLSEIENMSIAAILSTQLIHYFFIAGNKELFDSGELQNLKIIID